MQGNNTFKSELKGISGEIKKVWKNIVIKNYFFDSGNVRVNIQLRYSCLHANQREITISLELGFSEN